MTTRKKKEIPTDKHTFRVTAVPYQKDFKKFAAELEKTMNTLLEENYEIRMETHPQGILVCAQKQAAGGAPSLPFPLNQLLQHQQLVEQLVASAPVELPHLSRDTQLLLGKLISSVDLEYPDTFKAQIEKFGETLFRKISNEDLVRMSKELEEDVRTHHDRCRDPTCRMPSLATELASQIKRHIQLNLQ
jgi:hypothetical protein